MNELSTNLLKLFFSCNSIQNEIEYCLSKQALRLGLSFLELQVLWVIASSPKDLDLINISIVTTRPKEELDSILKSLEADGLVTRVRKCGSKRGVAIITSEGKELISELFICKTARCLLKDIPRDVLRGFSDQACNLIKNCDANEVVKNLGHDVKMG